MKHQTKTDAQDFVSKQQHDALQKEYDQFVYMVSHDLNSPFRHIKGFTEILINNLDEAAVSHNQTTTDAIQNAVASCQDMLNALLFFSRIKKSSEGVQAINLNEAVLGARKRLAETIKKSKAVIEIDDLPIINGYWGHLNELFYQLISNAIKFQPKGQKPHIKIKHTQSNDEHYVHIIDNGIGIESQFNDDVFTMFRKLNFDAQYPGTGSGLTFCRKIIDMHCGDITISQTDEQETCLTVHFPK